MDWKKQEQAHEIVHDVLCGCPGDFLCPVGKQVGGIVSNLDAAGLFKRSEPVQQTGAIVPPEHQVLFVEGEEIVYIDVDGDEHDGVIDFVITGYGGTQLIAYVVKTVKFSHGTITVYNPKMLRKKDQVTDV